MPDISKINALAIGSVSKVDGLAKASILDINGVTIPAGVAPPLDTYTGAAAAYSVRLLRTAYTGSCMRVREDGGNTETDIGFDGSGNLDTAAIASHCGSNNGFIRYWYDQSGNANDAGQATAASQPQIYNGTAVITENGKPAVLFDGSNDEFDISYSGLNINNLSVATVWQDAVGGGSDRMHFTLNNGTNQQYWHYVQSGVDRFWYAGTSTMNFGTTDTDQHLSMFIAGSTSGAARFYRDSVEASTSATLVSDVVNTAEQKLGNFFTGNFWWNGTTQEFIVWGADQYSNRTGIETNINGYFSIF